MVNERIQEIDEEALRKKWIAEAEAGLEPGEYTDNALIKDGGEDEPSMRVGSIKSAGWVYVYNTDTGEPSLCNRNMLDAQLRKRIQEGPNKGKLAFSVYPPEGVTPFVGTHKCMLHKDDPKRSEYDSLGLPVCPKSNLTSEYQVRRHMQKRHPVEWATIQEAKQASDKEEERAFQRQLQEAMATVVTGKPVKTKRRKKEA